MASKRLALLNEVFARLNATGKPTGLTVERFRLPDIEESEINHLNIAGWSETVTRAIEEKRSPLASRAATLILEARALKKDAETVDASIDAQLVWITKQMMSITTGGQTVADFTLGGKALKVFEVSTEFTGDETGIAAVLATRTYLIEYTTKSESEES